MAAVSAANAAVNASFLSQADDLLSRVLLDICVFEEDKVVGRRTGKMNREARQMRLSESDLSLTRDLVQQLRAGTITASAAGAQIASTSYYKTFVNTWDDDDEDLFLTHVKRYCHALRSDTGVAFYETDRYSRGPLAKSAAARQTPSPTPPPTADRAATFIEVGVFATRDLRKGEIVNLRGGVADLSEEEDDKMREGGGRSDFSVLWSERKKCFGLLLGPARFVNHDCRNNVIFNLTQSNMTFKVIEDIKADEELFTHYGDHYFDKDNAACLCATCQKLKRGAFTPKLSKAAIAAAAKRAAAGEAAPNSTARSSGRGHKETAKRSVSRKTRASIGLPTEGERRSERTSVPVDDLRTGPRLVHPRLAPPPLYVKDYEWDAKKKVAKYVGITTVPTSHKPKVKPSQSPPPTPNKSSTALGKRKRAASRSESTASTPRPKKKIVVSRTVELKKVTAGSRSSTRVLAGQGSVSARFRSFEKLKQSMGGGESDSELSELDESGDEGAEARKIAAAVAGGSRPIIVVHAKAEDSVKTGEEVEMLLNVVKSPDDTEDEHEVAPLLLAEPIGSTAPESPLEEVLATPAPVESLAAEKPSAEFGLQSPRPSPRPSSPRADPPPLQPPPGPSDAESQPSASNSNGASAPDNTTNSSGSASAPQFFRDSRSSIGGGAAGGSGGDDGEERKGKKPEKVDEEMRMDVDEVEEEIAGEAAVKEEGEENGEDVPASDTPSEGGSKRDSDTREAAAFLLMLKNTPSSLDTAMTDSSLLTPPEPGSSSASAASSTLDAQGTSSKAVKKRGRPSLEVDAHPASNPRSTRRNSHLPEEPTPPPQAPRVSQSANGRSPSHSRSPRASDTAVERKPSRPSLLGAARSSGSPMDGQESGSSRGTRRSAPLGGTIADILRDPAVMSVAGGWDPLGNCYVARGRVSEGPDWPPAPAPPAEPAAPPSPPPRPATVPAAALPSSVPRPPRPRPVSMHNGDLRRLVATPKERRSSTGTSGEASNGRKPAVEAPSTPSTSQLTSTSSRSTRLSAPIAGKLADLIASPEVSAVSGGFDASSGKYISNRRVSAIASPPVDVSPVTPEASGRSSRSRAPIAGSLADLVASPTVAAVSGGYNPETGKYSGIRKRGMGAGSPSVGEQPRE